MEVHMKHYQLNLLLANAFIIGSSLATDLTAKIGMMIIAIIYIIILFVNGNTEIDLDFTTRTLERNIKRERFNIQNHQLERIIEILEKKTRKKK